MMYPDRVDVAELGDDVRVRDKASARYSKLAAVKTPYRVTKIVHGAPRGEREARRLPGASTRGERLMTAAAGGSSGGAEGAEGVEESAEGVTRRARADALLAELAKVVEEDDGQLASRSDRTSCDRSPSWTGTRGCDLSGTIPRRRTERGDAGEAPHAAAASNLVAAAGRGRRRLPQIPK